MSDARKDVVDAAIIAATGTVVAGICAKAPNEFHNQLVTQIPSIINTVMVALTASAKTVLGQS